MGNPSQRRREIRLIDQRLTFLMHHNATEYEAIEEVARKLQGDLRIADVEKQ